MLSASIRKWLADGLEELAKSGKQLVTKRETGLGMRFDAIRIEAAEYLMALIRKRGPGTFEASILDVLAWVRQRYPDTKLARSSLIVEYSQWKNLELPLRSCEYFEGTETEEQAAVYEAQMEKFREEFELSRNPDEVAEERADDAMLRVREGGRRIGINIARQISSDLSGSLCERMVKLLRDHSPSLLTTEMAEPLSEQLVQGLLEEMARRLIEDIPQRLGREITRAASPK